MATTEEILSNSADEKPLNGKKLGQIVPTNFGPVQGFFHRLPCGELAEIFLGIPFAKPPIGRLRFEKPEAPDPWKEVFRAVEFGPASVPVEIASEEPISEDCLHLNIFRPFQPNSKNSLSPVFLYIHGGGFCSGSTRDYGFRGWADNFVPQGIVMVTIQYRLGPFGFLTLGPGTSLPGNLGLWDMAMALGFVHENIAHFGGDPQRVTVVGLSAGGAAAAAMAISPWTRDWVRASVEMSGTVLAEWTASGQTLEAGREFIGRALDEEGIFELDEANIAGIKERLKALSVQKILQIVHQMGTTRAAPNLLVWGPHLDGEFLPSDFPELIRAASFGKKPALMGLTEKEAIYFALQNKDKFLNPFGLSREQIDAFEAAEFEQFVRNVILGGGPIRRHFEEKIGAEKLEEKIGEMANEICEFYIGKKKKGEFDGNVMKNGFIEKEGEKAKKKKANIRMLRKYNRIISDFLFNIPLLWMAKFRQQCGQATFLYFNRFFNPAQFEPWLPLKGATHGNEYPYINGLFPVGEFEFTEADKGHQRMLAQMLGNFVKKGIPSTDLMPKWPSNIEENGAKLLKFVQFDREDAKCKIVDCHEGEDEIGELWQSFQFWTAFNEKFGFNLIRGIPMLEKL